MSNKAEKNCLPRRGADVHHSDRSISLVRTLVCLSLLVAAVVCGTVSYLVLRASEYKSYRHQYSATTKQMKRSVEAMLAKYHSAADQLAVIANIKYPNSSSWPFVGIHDFNILDQSVINVTGSASGNSILPIVATDMLPAFNAYAKDFLAGEDWLSPYPQIYDVRNFGVWNTKDNVPTAISDGVPFSFEGRDLIVPIINPPLEIAKGGFAIANLHGLEEAGVAMDDILSCTEQGHNACASLSNYLIDTEHGAVAETNIYRPIFSMDTYSDNKKVLGFTTVGFSWRQELRRLATDEDTNGLDVVLSSFQQPMGTESQTYSFEFNDDDVFYAGRGDKHDESYSSMSVNVPLSLIGSDTETSFTYLLTIYPTTEYENSFYTTTPLYTAMGFAAIIIFTSLVFFLYDYLVNENVKWKDHILKAKRDFVRFISHEIRTPLNTVSVGLQLIYEGLLAQHTVNEEELHDVLELTMDVQMGTSTAVSVVNDLLNFDKLQSGELQIAHDPVRVWDTVTSVVRSFKIPATQKNIAVELLFENFVNEEVTCKQLVVTGDKFKICHVIRNMMSNALKFTGEGGSIVVKVSWTSLPDIDVSNTPPIDHQSCNTIIPEEVALSAAVTVVTVSVTDSGYGLTAEQIGMLFRDGVQFNPNKLQDGQGSGLGLYLSQAIAVLHRGKMWATSEGEHKGATFNVQFPVEVAEPTSPSKPPRPPTDSPAVVKKLHVSTADGMNHISSNFRCSPNALRSSRESVSECRSLASTNEVVLDSPHVDKPEETILVVDDAQSNRKIVCLMLRKRGYKCEEAKDGREAVDIIESKNDQDFFSCVLMDFEMPVLNGPEATAVLRARGYRMPIYGLTGNVMNDDIEFFLRHGADYVLSKPFQICDFDAYMMESKV